jgi:hypothetical protein
MPTPKDQLQQWFQYLQAFQTACEQESSVASNEDLLTFANDTITADLPTPGEQANFLILAQDKTSLTITSSDIAASSTFESLLETVWNPLSMFVLGFVKSCAPPPYSAMGFTDFAQQLLSVVYPADKGDPSWIALQNGLTSSIPSSCFSAKQQTATNNLLASPKSTVQTLVDLISKLG